jgi:serine/threonine protein kinase
MTTNAPTSSSDATPSKSISKGDILLNVHEAQLPFIWRRNLGSGSCGIVEEVQDSNSGLLYARKRLLLRSWNKKSMQELFKNEVEIIESLGEHHHIIQIFATYTTKDILGIILYPVAESGDLHEYLANFHELRTSPKANQAEFDKRIVVLRQAFGCLAEGLSYMHERKIRHKDIKAQNILIHQDKIMYTDFGLSLDSKLLENSTTEDLAGMTRRYAAPEVIQNRPRNSFSDIFALGCVFLEIFSALTTGIPFLQQGEYSEAMPRIHTLLRSAEYPIELYSIFQTIIAMTSESVEVRPSAKFVATSLLGSPGFGCPQCCFNNTSAGVDGSQSQTLPPASSPASTNFSLGYIDDARSVDKLHNTPRDVVPARIGFRTRMLSKFAVRTPPRSVAPSYDPLGLTVIYQPESQPSLDIIFVHGINGTSRSSWSKDRDPEYFWPGKWLPFEPHISSARIISFGYRSNFASTDGSTDIGIADFAKDLLFEMKFARNGASTELELGKVKTPSAMLRSSAKFRISGRSSSLHTAWVGLWLNK